LPPLPVMVTFPRLAVCPKLLMPAYVLIINVDLNVKGITGLTFHSGHNIDRYVRNGYVADCGPRYDVCGTLKFELQTLGISDSRKECGKSQVVQGMKWLPREGNFEICDVTRGYTAYGVGLRQLELCQETLVRSRR
jgi:hypothetical protein